MKVRITFYVAVLSLAVGTVNAREDSPPEEEKETPSGEDADSQEPKAVLEDGQVFVEAGEDRKPLPLPAPARAIHQDGQALYVALGALGVQVYLISDQGTFLQRQLSLPQGHAVGFFTMEDRLWVETQATNAVVLDDSSGMNVAIASVSGGKTTPGSKSVTKKEKDKDKDEKKEKSR